MKYILIINILISIYIDVQSSHSSQLYQVCTCRATNMRRPCPKFYVKYSKIAEMQNGYNMKIYRYATNFHHRPPIFAWPILMYYGHALPIFFPVTVEPPSDP